MLFARLVRPSILARRTLYATSQLSAPPAKAPEPGAKTKPKAKAKAKAKTPAKKVNPPKKVSKEKAPEKDTKPHIPSHLKPPKRALGPYLLFYTSYVKSQPKASSMAETQAMTKRAGEIWNGYSMAEKQPFYDESQARKAQAQKEKDEFFLNTPTSELKKLNAIRKMRGEKKIHSTVNKRSLPMPAFIQFSNEFRANPDNQSIIENTATEKKNYSIRAVAAAADRWRSMSDEEKAPYFEKYKQAKEEMQAADSNP